MLAGSALAASVTVRVEGKTQPIFGSVPVKLTRRTRSPRSTRRARSASSIPGDETSFGTYVSQIGKYPGVGDAGWVFKVNGASPPVGADQVMLKDGDEVLWYYATFGATGGPADARR